MESPYRYCALKSIFYKKGAKKDRFTNFQEICHAVKKNSVQSNRSNILHLNYFDNVNISELT